MLTRVDIKHAGPTALGVLIPQGTKTLVIVRPRALAWDLLPARWDGDDAEAPRFCSFGRDEAANVARRLLTALNAAVAAGVNPVQTFGDPFGASVQVWVRAGEFVWIVCKRVLGEPYQPMIFMSADEATREAHAIAAVVWPAPDANQEYYFNTQNLT